MTVSTLHVTGTRGEVHPLMHARVDTEFYQSAYAKARNVIVSRYGPFVRVPGTLVRGRPKSNTEPSITLPFEFNIEQVYAMEFGVGYVRFWTPVGQVFNGGVPYEVATPYTADDLKTLHARQSGDKVYLFCDTNDAYTLSRRAETDWVLEPYVTKDGPYLEPNTEETTLTPGDFGSLTPAMVGNTSPSGQVITGSGASGTQPPWRVFDKVLSSASFWNSQANFVGYILPGSQTAVVDAYWIAANRVSNVSDRQTPISWTVEGSNDNVSWTVLDTQTAQQSWGPGERRFFEFQNKAAFRMYRLNWDASQGESGESRFSELGFNRAAVSQTPFTLTASSVVGINDDAGFGPDDVGRSVRLLGSDGRWRWAEIVSVVSPVQVTVVLHGHALPDLSPIVNWALGVFRKGAGPKTGVIYEDRMVLAGHRDDPIGMWFSVNGSYDSFRQSQPLVADDGFSIRLTGGSLDAIQWLTESGQLLAGTAGALRSVGSRGSNDPLAHDNIRQRAETYVGASAAQPETVESVVLFLDRMKKKLYETAFSFEADGYIAREVSTLNGHLFSSGVEQSVFVDAPHKVLVVRRTDGRLVFFSYDRDQKIAGGTLVDLGGVVEDISVLRGEGYPQLWMVVRRQRFNGEQKFVEILAPFHDPDNAGTPVFVAAGYTYEGAPTNAVSGLDGLRGETVGVWADGRDIGDAVVTTGGVLTLPHGMTASSIVAGSRMPWYMESLRLNSFGQQDGAGLGRKVRVVKARVDVYETAGVICGSLREQYHLRREADVEADPDMPTPLVTGMVPIPVDDSFADQGVFVLRGSAMYPVTIRAVSLDVEGEP